VIFDTNVPIYLSNYTLSPQNLFLSQASISVITKIEALGFSFKKDAERKLLLDLCNEFTIVSLTDEIAEATIRLRTLNKIKLPDAIIYATALVQNLPLLTNNIADFKSLGDKVELINPFDL
jgi:predicted nucleic acid-binding protein